MLILLGMDNKVTTRAKRRPLSDEEKKWSENLKRIWLSQKKSRKLTQEEAGNAMGWTQGAVGQYLNGKIPLNPSAMLNWANYLNVLIGDIAPEFSPLNDMTGKSVMDNYNRSEETSGEQVAINTLLQSSSSETQKLISDILQLETEGSFDGVVREMIQNAVDAIPRKPNKSASSFR